VVLLLRGNDKPCDDLRIAQTPNTNDEEKLAKE
jgi:hypothetical protein